MRVLLRVGDAGRRRRRRQRCDSCVDESLSRVQTRWRERYRLAPGNACLRVFYENISRGNNFRDARNG